MSWTIFIQLTRKNDQILNTPELTIDIEELPSMV